MAERHKSSIKRARQTVKRRQKNRVKRDQIKEAIKSVTNAKTPAEHQEAFKKATKVISRLSTKGILHKNTAARRQSRLAKMGNKLAKASSSAA
ncbi:MAG TPA: 30S ribosomal protein S20 [Candidatus Kapabacteria bacterium]|nr:30S ribosomal protein S20 [Candidatus Kapabacteria bacterium]